MSALRKSERINVMMGPDEIEALDDWRFANRVNGRSEAIRRLLKIGMAVKSAKVSANESA